jgi:hypothetical protein
MEQVRPGGISLSSLFQYWWNEKKKEQKKLQPFLILEFVPAARPRRLGGQECALQCSRGHVSPTECVVRLVAHVSSSGISYLKPDEEIS